MNFKIVFFVIFLFFRNFVVGQTFQEVKTNRLIMSGNGVLRPLRDTIQLIASDSGSIAYKNGNYYGWNGSYYSPIIANSSNTTASNGLTKISNDIQLGGTLTQRTKVTGLGFGTHFTDTLSSLLPYVQYLSSTSPNFFEAGTGKMLDSTSVFIGKGTSLNRTGVNDRSVYIGMEAGRSGTTGGFNIGIGYQSLRDATTLEFQTAIGYQSLMTIKSGIDNFAMGDLAFNTMDTSRLNVGIGSAVGERLGIRSDSNTLIGNYNSWNARAGTNANVAIGLQAMQGALGTTYVHNRNTIVGTQAARLMGANMIGNVFLGYRAGYNTTRSNALYIENSESETPLIEGDFAADSVRINGKFSVRDVDSVNVPQNMLYVTQEGKIQKAAVPSGASSVAGSNTEVQFNNAGSFGASNKMTYNNTDGTLKLLRPTGGDSSQIVLDNESTYIDEKRAITIKAPLKNDSTPDFHITSNLAANDDGTRSNHVVKMGFNYFNQHPSFGSNYTAMEGNWINGGVKYLEYHYQVNTAAQNETSRLFSSTFRLSDSLKRSLNNWDFRGTSYVWSDLENNPKFSISTPNGINQNTTAFLIGSQPVFSWQDVTHGTTGFVQYANGQFGTNKGWSFSGQNVNGFNTVIENVGGANGYASQFWSSNSGNGTAVNRYGTANTYLGGFYTGAFTIYDTETATRNLTIRGNGNWVVNDQATGVDEGSKFQVEGSGYFRDSLKVGSKLKLTTTPNNDDTLSRVLVRDGSTGEVKYRNASTIDGSITASATLNFSNTLSNSHQDLTVTLTGAADGDVVSIGAPNAEVYANTSYFAWVSASNTVTIRFLNHDSVAHDPNSATFKVRVWK